MKNLFGFVGIAILCSTLSAQHDHAHMHHDDKSPLTIPMARKGSGTSWQPDASPMAMIMLGNDDWNFMIHGNVFVGADWQGSQRNDWKFFSANWIMAQGGRKIGPGQFATRVMFSLEPLTIPGSGYPLLLQTGETWQGQPLHDHQHPHNLFMELATQYTLPITDELGMDFYAAAVGEPALGPVAFMHRTSARSNPFAPLGHHWMDSTHVSFGVFTVGLFSHLWKVEASWFNGREPGENRYNFDFHALDSFSARFFFNPIEALSFQASYGFLKSPEVTEPDTSIHRLTTSLSVAVQPWLIDHLAATVAGGLNIPSAGTTTGFGLAEFDLGLTSRHVVFGRIEAGAKTGHDLVLVPLVDNSAFAMTAVSLGYVYRFPTLLKFVPAVGAVATTNFIDQGLVAYYGGTSQVGGMIFLQLTLADQ